MVSPFREFVNGRGETHLTNRIGQLLAPGSIAVVGATDRPGPGSDVARNALRSTASGSRVYLINPGREELFGQVCHDSLGALPEVPEQIIFATSARVAIPVLEEAAALGVGAATILASGFAESSQAQGLADQEEVRRIASAAGMAVCGPNCLGVVDFERGIYGSSMAFPEFDPGIHPRSVGVISQSGGLLIGLVNRAAVRRLPLRCVISSGNEAVTGVEDYLEYLLADDGIKVVAIICEGFRDIGRVATAAKRARREGKRVALMKLGRSPRGRESVRAHTGRDAGDDDAIAAALSDAGIAQFDRTDELVEFCQLASHYPTPAGNRLAAIMVSGGAAALASDAAHRWNLPLARWSESTLDALRGLLPDYATASNPLDLTGGTMLHNRDAVERAIRLIAEDPETDVLSFVFPLQPDGGSQGLRNLVAFITDLGPDLGKPLIMISTSSGTVADYWADFSTRTSCAFLEDVETAFSAISGWCPKNQS